ncbi:MAG: hypothetical protein SVO01_00160 [Thermotogota bacterium]|nr:hypothetical protein [Thermotogota bacterium]
MDMKQRIEQAALAVHKAFEAKGNRVISLDDVKEIAYALKYRLESNLQIHGQWFTEHWRNGNLLAFDDQGSNIFTTEGMNFILDEVFNAGGACTGDLYCNIYKANVTPAAGDTAATKLGAAGTYEECQATTHIDEATRQAFTVAAASSANVTNTANKATFTIADTLTVYGGFVVTDSATTSTAGTLINAKKFATARDVEDGDALNVLISLTLTSS